MEKIVLELEAKLEAALADLEKEPDSIIRNDKIVREVRVIIEQLSEILETHTFPEKSEEIHYFKVLAPRLYSRLFYFMKIEHVESWRPYNDPEGFRELLEEELEGIKRLYNQQPMIYTYCRSQATYWDEWLFTRQSQESCQTEGNSLFIGPYLTQGGYWVSQVMANDRFQVWLLENLVALSQQETKKPAKPTKFRKLPWKRSGADLVELIYGMYLTDSFDKMPINEIAEFFGEGFGINLSQCYSTFQDIARRKKSQTKYLDLMREKVLKRMEEME
jgi:hypothetical protein